MPDVATPDLPDTDPPTTPAPDLPGLRTGRLTVAELLRLPVLQHGRPEVLAGSDLDRREVRWVHTSEIYEISPLLKGGEVLLTTGLGLVGAGATALRDYAIGLAERSVAALVLELGRTFTNAPGPLVRGARDAGLPLIALRGIVPFVEITESVHALLLSQEVAGLRLAERIGTSVTPVLLSGAGLIAVLRVLADLAGCPVRLYAGDGHLVAASDGARGRPDRGIAEDEPADAPLALVEVLGRDWGELVVAGSGSATRQLVADRGAPAVALELGRTGAVHPGTGRRRAGERLLREIFGRQYSSADELVARAAALGLVLRPGQRAMGICLAIEASAPGTRGSTGTAAGDPAGAAAVSGRSGNAAAAGGTASGGAGIPTAAGAAFGTGTAVGTAIAAAAEGLLGPVLVAELDGSHLVACCTDTGDPRALLDRVADAVDAALPAGRAVAVTGGPAVGDIASLARSLRTAREASVLARRLRSGMRTLLSSDLGVHRLLSRFATDPELAAFVEEQLGPLLDHDAAHDRELVRTLDELLACGLSKAVAARALGIRRQTLYQRLDTISTLLGGLDLGSRERRTALDLALVGWRLRSAAVPGSRSRT